MTAAEYLASEPVGNADLLEMLRRGTADVLYCTQHALAMHERVSGAAVLCAETEREARAALEHLRPCRAWNCAFWMKAIQTLCLNTITWRRAGIM